MTAPSRSPANSEFPGEDELMVQVQTGSVDAFEQLYDRYGERAYRVARSVCRDDGRAKDAVQEAFIAIWRSRATYLSQSGTVAARLLTAVRQRAMVADQVADDADADRLRTVLTQLPEAQREVITLAFYGQLTHTEIAAQLDLAPGIVKGRMRLGLRKLREGLQGD